MPGKNSRDDRLYNTSGGKAAVKTADVKKIRKKMEKELDAHRYEHTLGVAYTAARLAMVHGEDVQKAEIAGLLHDCAKCMSDEKRISVCEKNNIPISEAERANPGLLHAKVGAYLAEKEYDIQDEEVLLAIQSHTTGRPGMSALEKIIYIADFIEPGRKQDPNLPRIRKAAFEEIDKALLMILKDTLFYLKSIDSVVDPMTQETYDFYYGGR